MFRDVVVPFRDGIKRGGLHKVRYDAGIAKRIQHEYGVLSRYTEGHEQSDAAFDEKDRLEVFESQLEEYLSIKDELESLQQQD